MSAVNGIGGTNACENYFQFSDSSESYYQEIVDLSDEISMDPPTIVEISDGSYTEFNLLGIRVRRVDSTIYWDTTTTTDSFDAACGIIAGVRQLDGLQFSAAGTTLNDFQVEIVGTPSADDLLLLDAVLESLEGL